MLDYRGCWIIEDVRLLKTLDHRGQMFLDNLSWLRLLDFDAVRLWAFHCTTQTYQIMPYPLRSKWDHDDIADNNMLLSSWSCIVHHMSGHLIPQIANASNHNYYQVMEIRSEFGAEFLKL